MKKLLVLFIAITFFASFALIGCGPTAEHQSRLRQRRRLNQQLHHQRLRKQLQRLRKQLQRLRKQLQRQPQQKSKFGISGYILVIRIYLNLKEGVDYETKDVWLILMVFVFELS